VVTIENCSLENERITRMKLADLAHGLDQAHGPVLVMIGEALRMREHQPRT
jgi:uroporphyrin-III C-methyltransferase